ncbi:hypothetical protein ILUMI_15059, partial [Ignelater luminosus]
TIDDVPAAIYLLLNQQLTKFLVDSGAAVSVLKLRVASGHISNSANVELTDASEYRLGIVGSTTVNVGLYKHENNGHMESSNGRGK